MIEGYFTRLMAHGPPCSNGILEGLYRDGLLNFRLIAIDIGYKREEKC